MTARKKGNRSSGTALSVALAFVLTSAARGAAPVIEAPYASPTDVVADAERAVVYVAEHGTRRVTVMDAKDETVQAWIPLPDPPGGLALSTDGELLYVTAAVPAGRIHELETATGELLRSFPTGHTPVSPVIDPSGKTLWVCHRFANEVAAYALQTGKRQATVAVPREPIAAALTPDGKTLVVANHLPDGPANGDYTGAEVTLVDTAAARIRVSVALPNGSTGLRGLCLSPDGRFAYATHILGRYGMPTTQLDRGWVNTNAVSVVDVVAGELVDTVLVDDVDLGAANPWGIACTEDGALLVVAHSGTHEVSLIDLPALHEKLTAARAAGGRGPTGIEVSSDLSFLVGLRRRVRLAGNGPRGIALVAGRVFAAEHYSDSVGVTELVPRPGVAPRSIALAPARAPSSVRRGERLFHDATICFQSWHSCASCHPDGRVDGLNWDLLNDGLGNPKNVKSMLLAHATPPAMISGIRPDAESAVRSGLRHIHAAVRPEEEAADIDAYLKALRPVASPHLVDGKPTESALRGRRVFERAQCATCHPGPHFTDLKPYDLGTTQGVDAGMLLDTPTLVEVWRTAPYLHDGRAATLREAMALHDASLPMTERKPLTAAELDDVTAFVSTL